MRTADSFQKKPGDLCLSVKLALRHLQVLLGLKEREREIVREGFTGDVRFITTSALKRPHTVQREKSNWELKKIASAFSNRYC